MLVQTHRSSARREKSICVNYFVCLLHFYFLSGKNLEKIIQDFFPPPQTSLWREPRAFNTHLLSWGYYLHFITILKRVNIQCTKNFHLNYLFEKPRTEVVPEHILSLFALFSLQISWLFLRKSVWNFDHCLFTGKKKLVGSALAHSPHHWHPEKRAKPTDWLTQNDQKGSTRFLVAACFSLKKEYIIQCSGGGGMCSAAV